MATNKYNHRRIDALLLIAGALVLHPYTIHGESHLASIPTHHGINLDSLHLSERGGAVATKRRDWKNYYANHRVVDARRAADAPAVSTSYSPELMNKRSGDVMRSNAKAKEYEVPKATSAASHLAARKVPQEHQHDGLTPTAITCMSLLALQFSIQPILTRKFTPQTIVRSSVVLVQEVVKFGIAGAIYFSGNDKSTREKDFEGKTCNGKIQPSSL